MANRYWIGGNALNINDTAHWSTTSGGSGGASAPTTGDAAIFDNSSGAADITIVPTGILSCDSLTTTALTLYNLSIKISGFSVPTITLGNNVTLLLMNNGNTLTTTSLTGGNNVAISRSSPTCTVNAGSITLGNNCRIALEVVNVTGTLTAGSSFSLYAISDETVTVGNFIVGSSSELGSSTGPPGPSTTMVCTNNVTVNQVTIKNCTASGGGVFRAVNSTNGGANPGWKFSKLVTPTTFTTPTTFRSGMTFIVPDKFT